jgi:hypothetical protein
VTASLLPSAWRWSCFRRNPSGARVMTQVRERSSPTWNGMRIAASPHSRTCITSALPAKALLPGAGGVSTTTRPA